ncbi:MAG: Uma2 family endonuclease [Caldilineaceae bacterium]|nr:Uma2 family endonuclease [Caldilineaceae bacterium]
MDQFIPTIDQAEEFDDMGSHNHSLVQGNLAYLIRAHSDYSAFIELSLDTSRLDRAQFPVAGKELIPDVCVYPRRSVVVLDILVMQEMPKLVIEVISPRQGALSIVEKFQAYFALGVPSCWLVDPITTVVSVYHPEEPPKTFATGDVIDSAVDLQIPLAEIFR